VLTVALSAIRTRLAGYVGSFAAVAVAVAVIGACGLLFTATVSGPPGGDRYAAAAVVVEADQTLGSGPATFLLGADRVPERRYLPESAVTTLSDMDGVAAVVADVAFPTQVIVPGGTSPVSTGRSWAAAVLTPYTLVAGVAPGDGEVVAARDLADAAGLGVGDQVAVSTEAGIRQVRLVGIAAAPPGARLTPAIFFTNSEARQLAGDRVSAVGLRGEPGVGPAALAALAAEALPEARVLTGDARSEADPSPVTTEFTLLRVVVIAIGGNAGFVAVFVIAATFAFSVLQRHRDIALLRAIGATPRQVRRMIALEAALVSVAGAAAGAPLAAWLSGVMTGFLRDRGVVPAEFEPTTSPLPLAAAALAGMLVTQVAVFTSARRAARTKATEALREAVVEQRPVTRTRLIVGVVILAPALLLAVTSAAAGGENAAGAAFGLAMLLMVSAALLAPLAVRPFGRLLGAPAAHLTRATGLLAQANTAASARRVAGAATPLMLGITLGGVLLSTLATTEDATLDATAEALTADRVLLPSAGPGLPRSLAAGLPEVAVASAAMSTTVYFGPVSELEPAGALGVDAATIGQVMAIDADLSTLDGNTVAVSDSVAEEYAAGDTLTLTLGDGTRTELRVAAVYPASLGLPGVMLPADLVAAHSASRLADAIYVRLEPGATGPLDLPGTRDLSRDEYLGELAVTPDLNAAANYLLVAIVTAYLAISIANTLVTATVERRPEFRLLRLLGVTRRQVLRMVVWETVITVALSCVIAIAVSGIALFGVARGLGRDLPSLPVPVWLGLIAGGTVIGLLATVLPARAALREPAG
jgi:putative ABC transport system permease protein